MDCSVALPVEVAGTIARHTFNLGRQRAPFCQPCRAGDVGQTEDEIRRESPWLVRQICIVISLQPRQTGPQRHTAPRRSAQAISAAGEESLQAGKAASHGENVRYGYIEIWLDTRPIPV